MLKETMERFPLHPIYYNPVLESLYLVNSISDLNQALEAERNVGRFRRFLRGLQSFVSRDNIIRKVYIPNIIGYEVEKESSELVRLVRLFDNTEQIQAFIVGSNWDVLSGLTSLPTDVVVDILHANKEPQFFLRNVFGRTFSPDFRIVGLQMTLR